jgi:hypothetical protein
MKEKGLKRLFGQPCVKKKNACLGLLVEDCKNDADDGTNDYNPARNNRYDCRDSWHSQHFLDHTGTDCQSNQNTDYPSE